MIASKRVVFVDEHGRETTVSREDGEVILAVEGATTRLDPETTQELVNALHEAMYGARKFLEG